MNLILENEFTRVKLFNNVSYHVDFVASVEVSLLHYLSISYSNTGYGRRNFYVHIH